MPTIDYQPRAVFLPFHHRQERFACLVAHRRAGKTVACLADLLINAIFTCKLKRPQYAYVAPFYSQAKKVAWQYLIDLVRVIPNHTINQSELKATFPNAHGDVSTIQLYGGDNQDALRGIYLDGVVLDEYAQMPEGLFTKVVRPALSDRKGFCTIIGTPMGKNAFYRIHQSAQDDPDWFAGVFRASETNIIDAGELAALKKQMSDVEFEQEYECSFEAAIQGAFWGKELSEARKENRLTNVPYDPALQVITSWDLGMRDSTVVVFWQIASSEIRCINYLEFQNTGLPDIIREIDKLPYKYSQHIAPHDIAVKELGSGRTRREIAQSLGVQFDIAPRTSVVDGIEAFRSLIPRLWFDKERCGHLFEALTLYRCEYDERHGVFKKNPIHDWTSHFADSCRYFAVTNHRTDSWASQPIQYRDQNYA